MPLSYNEFEQLYYNKSREMINHDPDIQEIEENYADYIALVEFTAHDGEVVFIGSDIKTFTWDFKPVY